MKKYTLYINGENVGIVQIAPESAKTFLSSELYLEILLMPWEFDIQIKLFLIKLNFVVDFIFGISYY